MASTTHRESFEAKLLLVCLLVLPATAPAAVKCWTNNQGVRECGNAIPPEYAQKETRTLNAQGVTVEVQQRAKTPEEVAAERQRREQEAARLEEEKRQREAQATYDRVLLSTFNSQSEITASRERKLSAIEGSIEITQVTIDRLTEKLQGYRKRAADLERGGKAVPEELKADMASLQKQIADNQSYIAAKRAEQTELKTEYEGYLTRFRALMGAPSADPK